MKAIFQKWKIEDLIGAVMFICIGLFFLKQAQETWTNQADLIGPSLVPSVIAIILIILGLFTGVGAVLFKGQVESGSERQGDILGKYLKLTAITMLGFFYIWAFGAFGYLVSTFIVLTLILIVLGFREIKGLITIAVVGSIAYYLVFVKIMKIYDPSGSLIDFQSLIPF